MRNISVQLTQSQIRAGTKHVTRRLGWANAKPGDLLMACPKCQGLGPGGKMERIHPIRITSNHPESLSALIEDPAYGIAEARLEGFPELDGPGFVEMFCRHMQVKPSHVVNRLAFDHVFPQDWIAATLAAKTRHFHDEIKLHDEIARAFLAAGIPFEREVPLGDGRVDFLVLGHVSVEVKTAGSGITATRQSFRYLEDPRASQGIVISAAPMDLPAASYLASDGRTKPLHLVELWRNALSAL